jgi:site-specific DNA-methyltransferase (adenine-specific)
MALNLNTIIHGDCLEVMKDIPDKSIDAIITDPPYGTTACKWDSVIPFEPMWAQLTRIIKPNGAIVLFESEPFSSALRMSNIRKYKYDWYWVKDRGGNFLNAKKQPMRNCETISIFNAMSYFPLMENRGKPSHSIGKAEGKVNEGSTQGKRINVNGNTKDNLKYPKTVLNYAAPHPPIHPTQKPVVLIEYLIKTYTLKNEIVLDFCIGSGTTAIACLNTNRNFIGIEKDENYFNIATARVKNHQIKGASDIKIESKKVISTSDCFGDVDVFK